MRKLAGSAASAAILLLSFGILAKAENSYWEDRDLCIRPGLAKPTVESCTHAIEDGNDPSSVKAMLYNNRGVQFALRKEYDKAIADLTAAIQLRPGLALAYVSRATVYSELGKYQLAIDDINAALTIDPNAKGAFNNRAEAYARMGFYRRAVADATRAIAQYPDDPSPYVERCTASALGNFDLLPALADCDRALKFDGSNADALFGRGLVELDMAEFNLAIADFTSVLARNPNSEDAFRNRANAFVALHQYQRATADYDSALRLKVDDLPAQEGRCWVGALAASDLGPALTFCSEILATEPADEHVLDSRGFIELRLQKYSDAEADYDARLKHTPNSASSLYGRAVARSHLGDSAGAVTDAKAALGIDSGIASVFTDHGLTIGAH